MATHSQATVDRYSGRYSSKYLIDTTGGFSRSKLRKKSVVITGGASGIGEAALRAFVQAGAFVTFLDKSERGHAIQAELGPDKVVFVLGDVAQWPDQSLLFRTAANKAPSKQIDVVFANAGIGYPSTVTVDDSNDSGEPCEPDLKQVAVNLNGALYATKLAHHYFRRRSSDTGSPGCLIFTSSVAGYTHTENVIYGATKWGVRGLMRSLRTAVPETVMRVNVLAPWLVRTRITREKVWDRYKKETGALFCEVDDAASAVLHMASDETIHGRCLTVAPRKIAACGYVDLDRDGFDVEKIIAGWYESKL